MRQPHPGISINIDPAVVRPSVKKRCRELLQAFSRDIRPYQSRYAAHGAIYRP